MALFNRKKKVETTGLPAEVQDYYQAERREKTWMAWLLGFVTLIVTVLLALALFYGGRWVYRQVTNDEPATVAVDQKDQTATEQGNAADNKDETSSSSSATNGDSSTTQSSNGSSNSQTTAPSGAPSANTNASGSSTTGKNMPNTGPADTLAIFAVVSIVAYVVHRRFLTAR